MSNLPGTSAMIRRRYNDGQEWGNVEELLALQCELQDTANRLYYIGSGFKGHVWKPLHIRRPSEDGPELATPNEVHRFFATRQEALGNAVHSLS